MDAGTKKLILVVDDDQAVRESLRFSLELDGLTVKACDSAKAALDYKNLKGAACVILDYRMPGMDGFGLRESLVKRGIAAPVILITAPVGPDLRRRADEEGFFRVLEKPLLGNVLRDTVYAAIGA